MNFFDMDGKPIEMKAWATLGVDTDARRVAEDNVDGMRVVTMWLGHDPDYDLAVLRQRLIADGTIQGLGDYPPPIAPLIFGTCVFFDGGAEEVRRTPTREWALTEHQQIVDMLLRDGPLTKENAQERLPALRDGWMDETEPDGVDRSAGQAM